MYKVWNPRENCAFPRKNVSLTPEFLIFPHHNHTQGTMATQKKETQRPKPGKRKEANQEGAGNKSRNPFGSGSSENIGVIAAIAGIILSFFVLYAGIFDTKIDLNGDNINYYYLAKNLVERGQYAYYYDANQTPHGHFPPGYPWIMALFMQVSDSVQFLKMANGAFLLGSCLLLFFTLRHFGASLAACFTTVMALVVNATVLRFATIMMSEIPFVFFSLLALFLLSRGDYEKPFYKNAYFLSGMAVVVFASHIRSQGLAILPGILLFLALAKRWAYIPAAFGTYVVGMLPWQLRNQSLGLESEYISALLLNNPYRPALGNITLPELFARIGANAQRYLDKEIPSAFFSNIVPEYKGIDGEVQITWSFYAVGIAILLFVCAGLFSVQKNRPLIAGYVLGSAAILLIWPPVWYGNRFLLPLLPFLLFLMVLGIGRVADGLLSRLPYKTTFAPLLLVPLFYLFNAEANSGYRLNAKTSAYAPHYESYFNAARWAKENLPPDAVVACRKTELFYHFSGLHTVSFARTENHRELLQQLKASGATHAVLDYLGFSDTERYLYPAIKANIKMFRIAHETADDPSTIILAFYPNATLDDE